MGVSLGLAIVGGLIGGLIASRPYFDPPKHLFDDVEHWHDCEPPTDDDLHFGKHGGNHHTHDLKVNEDPIDEVEEKQKHAINH